MAVIHRQADRAPRPQHPLELGHAFFRMGRVVDDPLTVDVVERDIRIGERLGITHDKVRHPSMGGKPEFVAGMAAMIVKDFLVVNFLS